jgi:hypothetical protein
MSFSEMMRLLAESLEQEVREEGAEMTSPSQNDRSISLSFDRKSFEHCNASAQKREAIARSQTLSDLECCPEEKELYT